MIQVTLVVGSGGQSVAPRPGGDSLPWHFLLAIDSDGKLDLRFVGIGTDKVE